MIPVIQHHRPEQLAPRDGKDHLLAFHHAPGSQQIGIIHSLVGLAGVAAALGQPARAAQLLGAAEAIRESIGRSLTPVERTVFDRYAATIRAQLDDATFAVRWAEGQQMTLDQAKAEALGRGG